MAGSTLYQIADEYRQALYELSDPELPEEAVQDTLSALKGEVAQKGQAVAAFIMNLSAEVEMIKSTEKRIITRRRSLEARERWLRDYLKANMERCGITEIKAIDGTFTARIGKGRPSVVIDDENLIPDDTGLVRWKKEPNKTAIAEAIASGREVPGAHVETRPALTIR